jgi:hypothetical protein
LPSNINTAELGKNGKKPFVKRVNEIFLSTRRDLKTSHFVIRLFVVMLNTRAHVFAIVL